MENNELIFLEEDNTLTCKNKNVKLEDVYLSLSNYAYFYNRSIVINGQHYVYNIPNIDDIKNGKIYEIKVYQRLIIKPIEVEPADKQRLKTSSDYLEYFYSLFNDINNYEYAIDPAKQMGYKGKMRSVMDKIKMAGFGDKDIKRYIKNHILFGNYKGDTIYLEYLFTNVVVNNYIMYLRGGKKIIDLWPKLDIAISPLEKRKIKYLLNINNFDTFNEEELRVGMKLLKTDNPIEFEKTKQKYPYVNNFYAKVKVFEMIMKDEKIGNIDEVLTKCGHEKKYIQYEYIKEQLDNAKTNTQ